MTTTFVYWLEEYDAEFRDRYYTVVGEVLQDFPENSNGYFKIGSSRINSTHVDALQHEFPSAVFEEN